MSIQGAKVILKYCGCKKRETRKVHQPVNTRW
jgi:hypothetical protein